MKKLLFAILCAFMMSTMASAQYLNVKLDDGTYHSFKTTPNMEVSFGEKKGTEVTEPAQTVTVNGYEVAVKLAEDTPASDVSLMMYADGENAKIITVSKTNKPLRCTRDDNAEVPAPDVNVANGVHTFSISGISQDVVATVEYDMFTVHLDLLSHGGTAPEDISVMRGAVINVTPTASDGYEFRGWYMEPSCAAGTEWNWSQIKANKTGDITLYAKWVTKINDHDCVKLGGIYWATENVKAYTVSYMAIDDTCGYYYSQENDNALKAAKSWGGTWTLPSKDQCSALIQNCTWTWKDSYLYNGKDVAGMFVTGALDGEIGHSIFLPAAGYYVFDDGVTGKNKYGYYWSSDIYECIRFEDNTVCNYIEGYKDGLTVRPVSE